MRIRALLVVLFSAHAGIAGAFVEDNRLEQELRASDDRALALLPAKGFEDGVAGFFRAHGFFVVPNSERAWCQDRDRGVLGPGCYVEFLFQAKGRNARTASGEPCGLIGRWQRAPGSQAYVPTRGATYSRAIASGDWQAILLAIYEESPHVKLGDVRRIADCAQSSAMSRP